MGNKRSQENGRREGLRGHSVPGSHEASAATVVTFTPSELRDHRMIFSRGGLGSDLHFIRSSLASVGGIKHRGERAETLAPVKNLLQQRR